MSTAGPPPSRLSGEDLVFWWLDSPMQPTTMAMLMLLDRLPNGARLRGAFERAIAAVPRLAQQVVSAPLDLSLPRWEVDPTFDLEYHVRRHTLAGSADFDELLREIRPVYEAPFDRSRPLWEVRLYDGLTGGGAALFFKLHHAVADGVGGNAIFAALTDWEREPAGSDPPAGFVPGKGSWPEASGLAHRLAGAVRDRVALDIERAGAALSAVTDVVAHPAKVVQVFQGLRSAIELALFDSRSPLKRSAGRARRLSVTTLPFAAVRELKIALGGSMIDVILTIMTRAIGRWYAAHGLDNVGDLMTLVPINLRKPEEWVEKANIGNVTTGVMVPLPIRIGPTLEAYHEIRRRMAAKKADPLSHAVPALAELLSVLPRGLFTWMAEASFGSVDFIVTNVPGILVPRFLAGAEIVAAYPFAPVAMKSPVSVALYGYRDQLHIGLDSDEALMPDIDAFKAMIRDAFDELREAAGLSAPPPVAAGSHPPAVRRKRGGKRRRPASKRRG